MVKIQAMHFCSETINNIFYSKIEDMTYIVKKKTICYYYFHFLQGETSLIFLRSFGKKNAVN